MLGLESMTGALENFGVEDFLNGIVALDFILPHYLNEISMVILNAPLDHLNSLALLLSSCPAPAIKALIILLDLS